MPTESGSIFDKFLKQIRSLHRENRALALEANEEIEKAYKIAALEGDTTPPAVGEEVDYHYIAVVPNKTNDKIFFMDGVRKGPVDTGITLDPGEDFFPKSLKIIQDLISHIDGGVKFNLLALVHS